MITTVLITSTLLIVLLVASFVSTNILSAQMESTEFEQAKTNMGLLDNVIQDVALRQGAGGYVQFNERTGGIGLYTDETSQLKLSTVARETQIPETFTLLPNADGSISNWNLYGNQPDKWSATSDTNDATGIQIAGSTSAVQTVNLQESTQTGTINSVTARIKAKTDATSGTETLYVNSFDNAYHAWTETGSSPYLNDNTANWISTHSYNAVEGNFAYADHTQGSGQILSARVYFESKADGNDDFSVNIYDGSWHSVGEISPDHNYGWQSIDVTSYLNSWTKVDGFRTRVQYEEACSEDDVFIRRSYLSIEYAGNHETAKFEVKTNGSTYESSQDFTVSRTGFTQFSQTYTTNPVTGDAWSWSDLDNLEVGCRASALDANEKIQVSEVTLEVSYTSPPELTTVHSSLSLTSFIYRAGSQTSGTSQVLTGDDDVSHTIDQPIGYLRVESDDGLKIKLDYNRVRTVYMGTIMANNSVYDAYDITVFHVVKGTINSASDVVSMRVQNQDINTNSYTYESGVKIVAQINDGQIETCVDTTTKTIVMITEITIVASIT